LLQKAFNKDEVNAIFYLAVCYFDWNGIEQYYQKSFELFQKSKQRRDYRSYNMIGISYENGTGTDIQKAI
jgi:TPR repeat protein